MSRRDRRNHKGMVSFRTPRTVGVSLSMSRGLVTERCPHCRALLYWGPMDSARIQERSKRFIAEHVHLCKAREELVKALATRVSSHSRVVLDDLSLAR